MLGFVDWLDEVLIDLAHSGMRLVNDRTLDAIQALDLFRTGRRKYIEHLEDSLGHIRILGMAAPTKLKHLYVSVALTSRIASRVHADFKSLLAESADEFRQKRMVSRTEDVKVSDERYGHDVVEHHPRLVVLGKPGSGKTTFLKYLALHYSGLVGGPPARERLPIFITLRTAVEGNPLCWDYVVKSVEATGFQHAGLVLERLATKGQCIFLFDGLDEVPEANRGVILRAIEQIAAHSPHSAVVVSSRTPAYEEHLEAFTEVEVCDFAGDEIATFVRHWFKTRAPAKGEALLALLDNNPQIGELATSPLLASLICILYDYQLALPRGRAELYDNCIRTLLKDWDARRGFRRETRYERLSESAKILLFQKVAAHFLERHRVAFKEKQLIAVVAEFLELMDIPADEAENVLHEVESHHGILMKCAANAYSFSHLTLQEFFAAAHYARCPAKLIAHLRENAKRWQEVGILAAAFMEDATDYISGVVGNDMSTIWSIRFISDCMIAEAPIRRSYREGFFRNVADIIDKCIARTHSAKCFYQDTRNVIHLATESSQGLEVDLLKFIAEVAGAVVRIDTPDVRAFLREAVSLREKGTGRTIYRVIGKALRSREPTKRIYVHTEERLVHTVTVS